MPGERDRDVAVPTAEADVRDAEARSADGDMDGDGVPGLLVGRLRHAAHDDLRRPTEPHCLLRMTLMAFSLRCSPRRDQDEPP